MTEQFYFNITTRQRAAEVITGLSLEQLTKIPNGFNNCLHWNICHVAVTQQLLTYALCGLKTPAEQEFIDAYRKGTKPDNSRAENDLKYLLSNYAYWPQLLERDYRQQAFTNFQVYRTSYGVQLNSIEDAIKFNNMHEALHLGIMMTMRKLV
jgi:hypothetical protein